MFQPFCRTWAVAYTAPSSRFFLVKNKWNQSTTSCVDLLLYALNWLELYRCHYSQVGPSAHACGRDLTKHQAQLRHIFSVWVGTVRGLDGVVGAHRLVCVVHGSWEPTYLVLVCRATVCVSYHSACRRKHLPGITMNTRTALKSSDRVLPGMSYTSVRI